MCAGLLAKHLFSFICIFLSDSLTAAAEWDTRFVDIYCRQPDLFHGNGWTYGGQIWVRRSLGFHLQNILDRKVQQLQVQWIWWPFLPESGIPQIAIGCFSGVKQVLNPSVTSSGPRAIHAVSKAQTLVLTHSPAKTDHRWPKSVISAAHSAVIAFFLPFSTASSPCHCFTAFSHRKPCFCYC